MANRARPRCPKCQKAMAPSFVPRPRGETVVRIPDVFYCVADHVLARGRGKRVRFLS